MQNTCVVTVSRKWLLHGQKQFKVDVQSVWDATTSKNLESIGKYHWTMSSSLYFIVYPLNFGWIAKSNKPNKQALTISQHYPDSFCASMLFHGPMNPQPNTATTDTTLGGYDDVCTTRWIIHKHSKMRILLWRNISRGPAAFDIWGIKSVDSKHVSPWVFCFCGMQLYEM